MSTQTPLKPSSKYLSPCRTFGLKRKSLKTPPGSLFIPLRTPNGSYETSTEELNKNPEIINSICATPLRTNTGLLNTPLKAPDGTSTEELHKNVQPCNNEKTITSKCATLFSINRGIKSLSKTRVLENIPNENIKRAKLLKTSEIALPNGNSTASHNNDKDKDNSPFEGFVSKDDLVALISRVNTKMIQVKSLKRNEIYSKKHDVEELCQLTEKWKEAFKQVVYAIQEELKLKGQEVPLNVILQEHNIPFEAVGFREDEMDFE